ncbi:MAG: phospholipase D/Transphosphatidylase [Bacteroidetes bacterium]|nr:phospholipase D/Transphosphatidylase [Bacteroidota bacterium]
MNSFQSAEATTLVLSGDPFFEALDLLIAEAKEIIHIQIYIFEADKTGLAVIDALKAAVKRGVAVFVLADAYGSKSLPNSFLKEAHAAGIHFRLFSPFFSTESIYMGRRLHHKIVVADKNTAMVGGINIADKYHGTEAEAAWLDYAVLVKGNVCEQLHSLCESIYRKRNFSRMNTGSIAPVTTAHPVLLRFTKNDWVRGKNEIYRSYLHILQHAKNDVIFVTSYFLPGYRFRKALKDARKRGVSITIILAGKSDMPLLFYAEKYLYHFFLRNGIHIYEWKRSTMHAKALVMDEQLTTIGSYNLNPLSRYRSIELNAEISDLAFATGFRKHVAQLIENDCVPVTLNKNMYEQTRWSRIKVYLFYYFFKIFFSVFISKKVNNN